MSSDSATASFYKLPRYDPATTSIVSFLDTFEPLRALLKLEGEIAVNAFLTHLDFKSRRRLKMHNASCGHDWPEFKEQVLRILSSPADAYFARRQLMNAKQCPSENVSDYGERLLRLARIGYRPDEKAASETMLKDALFLGLVKDEIAVPLMLKAERHDFLDCLREAILLDSAHYHRVVLKVERSTVNNDKKADLHAGPELHSMDTNTISDAHSGEEQTEISGNSISSTDPKILFHQDLLPDGQCNSGSHMPHMILEIPNTTLITESVCAPVSSLTPTTSRIKPTYPFTKELSPTREEDASIKSVLSSSDKPDKELQSTELTEGGAEPLCRTPTEFKGEKDVPESDHGCKYKEAILISAHHLNDNTKIKTWPSNAHMCDTSSTPGRSMQELQVPDSANPKKFEPDVIEKAVDEDRAVSLRHSCSTVTKSVVSDSDSDISKNDHKLDRCSAFLNKSVKFLRRYLNSALMYGIVTLVFTFILFGKTGPILYVDKTGVGTEIGHRLKKLTSWIAEKAPKVDTLIGMNISVIWWLTKIPFKPAKRLINSGKDPPRSMAYRKRTIYLSL